MSATLAIDTTSSQKTRITLKIDGRQFEKISAQREFSAQQTLLLIDQALAEARIKPTDLTEIKVNPGPGSFTGLRVGITIASMLGMLLSVPVNGRLGKTSIVPRYATSKYDQR